MEEIIARTYYEEDFKKVKYEEIITYFESCYARQPEKKEKEIKEIV